MNYINTPVYYSKSYIPHLVRGDILNVYYNNKIIKSSFIEFEIGDDFIIRAIVHLLENYQERVKITLDQLLINKVRKII